MVEKLESTAKAADGAGLEKEAKGDQSPPLNLVDLKAGGTTKAADATTANTQADKAMKGFPTVDIFDSHPVNESAKKAENRSSMNDRDTPRFAGTGNWAKLDDYTPPTEKPDSPREQNRRSFNVKEQPKYEGTANW